MANNHRILSTTLLEAELIMLAAANGALLDCFDFIRVDLLDDADTRAAVTDAWTSGSVFIFTSANAVRAVARIMENSTMLNASVFCISGATLRAVETAWPGINITGTADDAVSLSQIILASGSRRAIFFCGHSRLDVLPDQLRGAGVDLIQIPVYRTVETPVTCSQHYQAVLCYSPSGVRSYFSANTAAADTTFYAIGQTTERALRNRTNNNIIVSPRPDKKQMLAMALGIQ